MGALTLDVDRPRDDPQHQISDVKMPRKTRGNGDVMLLADQTWSDNLGTLLERLQNHSHKLFPTYLCSSCQRDSNVRAMRCDEDTISQ